MNFYADGFQVMAPPYRVKIENLFLLCTTQSSHSWGNAYSQWRILLFFIQFQVFGTWIGRIPNYSHSNLHENKWK